MVLRHPDTAAAAAIAIGVLARSLLAGRAPAGLLRPSEVLNPTLMLRSLETRGLQLSHQQAPGVEAARAER